MNNVVVSNTILSIEYSSKLEELIIKVKEVLSSTKTVAISQAWGILQLAVAETIQTIENNNPSLKGSNKKEIAMNMISNFYDKVFLVVNIPFLPAILQPIIQKYIKALLMLLVSSTVDSMVEIFRKTGIFDDAKSVIDPTIDIDPKVSDK
jgi:hypothetical protein